MQFIISALSFLCLTMFRSVWSFLFFASLFLIILSYRMTCDTIKSFSFRDWIHSPGSHTAFLLSVLFQLVCIRGFILALLPSSKLFRLASVFHVSTLFLLILTALFLGLIGLPFTTCLIAAILDFFNALFSSLRHHFQNRPNFNLINALPYLTMSLLMVLVIHNKENFFVDELLSYGLANHEGRYITIEDMTLYRPADTPFMDYLTVNEEHAFDYHTVWMNQSQDVHPPPLL